jgi:hypothetical protein
MGSNPLPPPRIDGVRQPDWGYDGTRCEVTFSVVPNAAIYEVWVGADPSGVGAVVAAKLKNPGGLVRGLRPGANLYLWLTYTETPPADGAAKPPTRQSRPSPAFHINLVDAFGQK